MRKRFPTRCAAAAMLIVTVALLSHQEEAAATPQPPAAIYARAWQAVRLAPRFSLSIQTHYAASHQAYATQVRYIAPDRAYESDFEGPDLGTVVFVQVGSVGCHWNVAPPFRRIFCGRGAGWDNRRLQNTTPILPIRPTVRIVQTRQPRGITTLAIRGAVRVLLCPPGDQCGSFPVVPVGYEARLTIARSSGLPLSLSARIDNHRRTVWRQTATYTYDHSVSIALPKGPRITCPNWVPHDQWCLAQRR